MTLVSDRCLDPELAALDDPVTVVVDVSDDHRDRDLAGLGYLILRSSSAAAKNAADAQDLVRPAELADLPLKLADPRRVVGGRARSQAAVDLGLADPGPQCFGMNPSWSATRLIAPVLVAGSRRASKAIRVARSLNSSL